MSEDDRGCQPFHLVIPLIHERRVVCYPGSGYIVTKDSLGHLNRNSYLRTNVSLTESTEMTTWTP